MRHIKLTNEVKTELHSFIEKLEIAAPEDVNGELCDSCKNGDCCEYVCSAMQLTIACNNDGTEWSYQTGDNSYTGGCYSLPHWAVGLVSHDCNRRQIMEDLIDQLEDIEVYDNE